MQTNYAEMMSQMATTALHQWQQLTRPLGQGLASKATINPQKWADLQLECFRKQAELWQALADALPENKPLPDVVAPKGDPRFSDTDWASNPLFSFLRQSYLLNTQMIEQQLASMEFEDATSAQQIQFYARQYMNACSPANFAWSNPEVVRDTLARQGENLRSGMANLLEDLAQSPAASLRVSQVDGTEFCVGKNVASTEGAVVYRNKVMELIQYTPRSREHFARPLLIVPPFINKYYILDLNERKSLVRWLLDQGFSVFMISWVNPDAEHKQLGFADYLTDGVVQAARVVQTISGADKINAAGYCVGGTLLACAEAWLSAREDSPLASVTLLTTLLDFSEPGDLGHYMTRPLLDALSSDIQQRGYFDGRVMATSFNFLRENNLYWPNFINNYLLGKKPPAFDLLYWNSDSTHMSAAVFEQYVKAMYLDNRLTQPNGLIVRDTPVNLGQITCPSYVVGAQSDHIVLWQAAYRSAQLLSSQSHFILAGSGHIAGIVNPPAQQKYGFHCLPGGGHGPNNNLAASPEQWLEQAEQHAGSWWPHWAKWLATHAGTQVPARAPGHVHYPPLAAAPGEYVLRRV
ncbi:class I poly(R)-hydroxyalkanoic acid synthase [Simiduia sp. 21SJ11W-1]|uniref:PHA/PHB synthase family protein n=1 Tax=Simiduia sp. 21SJ11W-1 TaxID=2909669 RepID=UPI00209E849C|nr:class I poly(R)-hydroxyalkanoic acid synthase [Simiduia sp. 21SJ11W-1]UTA47607.1 class I poly(R)-hydroxyalkanoic acid synthase [Simiduia sp. 21SJ11W-1]